MSEIASQPMQGGYVHRDTRARQEYEAAIADLPIPMRRADYEDQCSRDVGSATDEPVVSVWADRKGFVTIRGDEKTMAALLRATRLMVVNEETQAREAALASEKFPPNSYGRNNRISIALRRERVARRLKVVDAMYREAVDKEFWNM